MASSSSGAKAGVSIVEHPLYSAWLPLCNATSANVVLHRNDNENIEGGEQKREWSVTPLTFATTQPHCNTTHQLLHALRYGVRRPLPGYEFSTVGRERARVEWAKSWFEPAGCSLRWYSPDEICGVFNRYSHVVLAGDSLTRHLHQALYMMLTGDLRYGGLPRLSWQRGLFDSCQCDGQFSEHSVCREYDQSMFNMTDTRVYGVCTHTDTRFALHALLTYDFPWSESELMAALCSDDPRPRFFMVSGHAHYASKREDTMRRFLTPLLDRLDTVRRQCNFTVHVMWGSAPAQSRLLDGKFPMQVSHPRHTPAITHANDFSHSSHCLCVPLMCVLCRPVSAWWSTMRAWRTRWQHAASHQCTTGI